MNTEDIRAWFTVLSAVVAAATFAIGLIRHRSDIKSKKIFDWQKVVIHEIFEKSETASLNFSEIRSKYLAEAQSYQGEQIPQKELAISSLRRILVSMVADNIIRQYNKDRYSLNCEDFISIQSRIQANEKSIRIKEIYYTSYSEALSNPFKLSVDQMISRIADLKGYKPSEIRVEIEHMLNVEKLYLNSAGRIGPKHKVTADLDENIYEVGLRE